MEFLKFSTIFKSVVKSIVVEKSGLNPAYVFSGAILTKPLNIYLSSKSISNSLTPLAGVLL